MLQLSTIYKMVSLLEISASTPALHIPGDIFKDSQTLE